jgi:predicted ATP-grasp superfamily ATP-dependent carboligase
VAPRSGPGAVVVGGYINALGLVRSLAASGSPVVVVRTQPFDIAHRSRWVAAYETVGGLEESAGPLVELLERRAADWKGWLVIPTTDDALRSLAENGARLSGYRLACPPAETASYFLDKARMVELARSVGIPFPRCYGPAVASLLQDPEISYPVVVKPSVGYRFSARFGVKLFAATSREQLGVAIARLSQAGLEGQVFDLVPGDDSRIYAYCTFVDRRGVPRGGLTIHKLRQAPPFFGSARVAEIVEDRPALREMTEAFLSRVGFRGFAAAEFKLDPRDETYRFIEINGRSVVYNGLLRKGGMDVASLLSADSAAGVEDGVRPSRWPGVWIDRHTDLLYSMLFRRHQAISARQFLAPYRRPIIDAVWSARDPTPSLTQWLWSARRGASALRREGLATLLTDRTRLQ